MVLSCSRRIFLRFYLGTSMPFFLRGHVVLGMSEVFSHAACVVTLVDRLIHRAEVIDIEAESYRLKEAKELNAASTKQRKTKKP
jgi:DNA replication protein DnaC